MTRKHRLPVLVISAVLMAPSLASAQVVISEIMYDVDGADTGHEWIEIFNGTASPLPLTEWRLFEADTNHKMTAVQGTDTVAPGGYAVVADNAPIFLADHPGFSGQLFDSAFSLSNDGETIALHDASLAEADSVSYLPAWGAGGDGQSLERTSTEGTAFAPASPTPGMGSLVASTTETIAASDDSSESGTADTGESDTSTAKEAPVSSLVLPVPPEAYAYAGLDRTVITGADVELDGEAFDRSGDPIENVRFHWNFGDGAVAEGAAVLHHWSHPGRYAVVLTIAEDKYAAEHQIIVTAEPADLALSTLPDGSIVIGNEDSRTLDLSGWHIRMNDETFDLPDQTMLLAGAAVAFTPEVTSFRGLVHPVELLYPNGEVAVREGGVLAASPTTTSTTTSAAVASQPESAILAARASPALVPPASAARSSSVIGMRVPDLSSPAAVAPDPAVSDVPAGAASQEIASSTLLARVDETAAAADAEASGSAWWWVGLGGLIAFAAASVILLRRRSRLAWDIVEEISEDV